MALPAELESRDRARTHRSDDSMLGAALCQAAEAKESASRTLGSLTIEQRWCSQVERILRSPSSFHQYTNHDLATPPFDQTLLKRSRELHMIPVQFLHWEPCIVQRAILAGHSLSLRAFKRTLDLLIALLGSLLILPFLPLIILAIKRDSPGDVIYRQARVGYHGQPFTIYKFRTMRADAERNGPSFAKPNDPRVTPFGSFMRKTRIDEIPQLWNVLKGEMSLVGPRPERPELITRIEQDLPEFPLRLAVKPGLTGWAQTQNGYAGTVDELRQKLEYDLYYIRFSSIWLEIYILLRTVHVVLARKGT